MSMRLTYLIVVLRLIETTLCVVESEEKYKPCLFSETVNITDGIRHKNGSIEHEGFIYNPKIYDKYDYEIINSNEKVETERHIRGCKCKVTKCVRFCNETSTFIDLSFTEKSSELINLDDQKFHLVKWRPCQIMFAYEPEDGEFKFHKDGKVSLDGKKLHHNEYCFKHNGNSTEFNYCFVDEEKNVAALYPIGMAISLPFLILTFLIYAIVPDLRSIHGKNLMCYIFCLTFYYTTLVVTISIDHEKGFFCTFIGYFSYYFGLATFCWLNVMCFEIFTKIVFAYRRGGGSAYDLKLFFKFCVYGFGAPLVFSVIIFLLDNTPIGYFIQNDYLPKIGQAQYDDAFECFVQTRNYSQVKYFYSIITLITVSNFLLFAWILITIFRIKKALKKIPNTFVKDTKRFYTYLKLFILMGIFWLMEPISSFFTDSAKYFYFTDAINCLQGLIIFILFVTNKKVFKLLKKRIGCKSSDVNPTSSSATVSSLPTIAVHSPQPN